MEETRRSRIPVRFAGVFGAAPLLDAFVDCSTEKGLAVVFSGGIGYYIGTQLAARPPDARQRLVARYFYSHPLHPLARFLVRLTGGMLCLWGLAGLGILLFMGASAAHDAIQGTFAVRWKSFIDHPLLMLVILPFTLLVAAGFVGGLWLIRLARKDGAPVRISQLADRSVAWLLRD